MGFKNVAAGPLARLSYHADQQVQGAKKARTFNFIKDVPQ